MLIIKNAKIYTMADRIIDNGYIVIEDGKIVKVDDYNNEDLSKFQGEIIDANGMVVLPGLIDCHSHVGGMNFSERRSIDDLNEMTNNITADMEAIYGVDPQSQDFRYAYESGITTLGITPGSGNVICGLVFATKTYGDNIFDMSIKNPVALKVALGGNPKRTYGDRKLSPSSRMAIPSIIIDLFDKTERYMKDKEAAQLGRKDMPSYDKNLEAIIPVLKKEMPLKIHCTQFDTMTAIEITKRFDLNFSLDHAWGASEYMEEIVDSGCSIVFGPVGSIKSFGEARLIDIESVAELDNRGVLTALTTDAPILSIDSLIHHAGEAVRSGLEVERALKMITINPAKILGLDDRIGSIEEGKDADILLFQGIPAYNTNAKLINTIINGEVVFSFNAI
ncbi:amidohydrolase family protein [Tissierella sp. MSJ-40]|uniref:Amidohydrolase family protein n=1 Tax=Tissierella simiarum TaxID=2841534 RepID=A0ABS6E0I0_9FIRM|nr:amidohydrolase family protein [Tissierella simiarum]MBU5436400.1 amidohydrolase family protein [Tissierella simiarum]